MTKYILHGGFLGETNRDNNNFFREITSGLKGRIKILLVYFARDESRIDELTKLYRQQLLKYSKNKNLDFRIATLGEFEKQLKWANAVYIDGGKTVLLVKKLKAIKNIEKLFKGKVVAGSSAGAYALSKYYFGNTTRVLGEGLGILNIKCYCHCEPKDTKTIKRLLSYKEELPLILLPNYKMHIVHK